MMNVRDIPIESIREYENNPRRIPEFAVKKLVNSIREFGFKVPVILDENRVIVSGHTRMRAARELGMREVPCIVADDLSPEQIKAFRLADNKAAELTNWDIDKLGIELNELMDIEIDMSEFGFRIGDVDVIDEMADEVMGAATEKKQRECPNCGYKF